MLKVASLLFSVSLSYGANILAIIPMPSYSHQIAFAHIWKELSLRGHKVTVVTTDPINDPKLTNLTEIDMKFTYMFMENISKSSQTEFTIWTTHKISQALISAIAKAQLSHSEIQKLIHSKSQFDVVLVEFLYPEFLAFAEIYNCPSITICSLDATAVIHQSLGNSINPILYPDMGSSFRGSLDFKGRIISILYTCYTLYFYRYKSFHEKNEIVKRYFNISKTVNELVRNVDMLFVNVNPFLQPVRAIGPSTVAIGGKREIEQYVTKDLAKFLDNAVNGFIYFSLGNNVQSKDLPKETLEAITEAFRELPYSVLWKFEADEVPNKPENIKFIKWAPQQAVLSHPNIKVFVTQGGLQSVEEAFYRGVPFVVIPFFGDQDQNARMLELKGVAVIVNRTPSVSKVELKNAILEVINNPKYRNTVEKLKQLALDSPMTGLEKAVWWTEYVIRNKGAKHLRNPAADISFYQYCHLDFIGVLLTVFLLLCLVLRIIYRYTKLVVIKFISARILNRKKLE